MFGFVGGRGDGRTLPSTGMWFFRLKRPMIIVVARDMARMLVIMIIRVDEGKAVRLAGNLSSSWPLS